MNTLPDLRSASNRFNVEVSEIEFAFYASENGDEVTQYAVNYTPHTDGCVVSLWDAWNRFLRELMMLSASGTTRGLGGDLYTPAQSRNEEMVLVYLVENQKSLGVKLIEREPSWYLVQRLAAMADGLGLANASVVIGAVGLSSIDLGVAGQLDNPLGEIQTLRNFIAHKNPATLRKVVPILSPSGCSTVHDYLWNKSTGGVERFGEWLAAVRVIAEATCW